jgi:hypothetical protein
MDIIIIYCLGKFKFRISLSEKGRILVFFADINIPPVVKRFNIMHMLSLRCKDMLSDKKTCLPAVREKSEEF